jgi:hypothetical protein
MAKESELRDWLSENLHKIEPGLVLIAKEFHLKGYENSSGFVDILAKDQYGLHVVIELKRSESTAREAAHELIKYTHLLRQEYGIGNEDVRCILVSTDWRELGAVAADLQSHSPYRIDYIVVEVCEGTGISLKPYSPENQTNRLEFWRHHMFLVSSSQEERQILFTQLQSALHHAGATSAAVLWMDYVGGREEVILPYGLYVAIAAISEEARAQVMVEAREDLEVIAEEVAPFTFAGYFLSRVTEHTAKYSGDTHVSDPDIYWAIRDTWTTVSVSRFGDLETTGKLITDSDIESFIAGKRSDAEVKFTSLSNPSLKASWQDTVDRVMRCVAGTSPWEAILSALIREIESDNRSADVRLHVYNPCDTLMSLFQLVGRQSERYVPQLLMEFDGKEGTHRIIGFLVWDGMTRPEDLERTIYDVFGEDFFDYMVLRGTPESDNRLVDALGLKYSIAEWILTDESKGFWLEYREGRLYRLPVEASDVLPLREFLEQNQTYLGSLVEYFQQNGHGL